MLLRPRLDDLKIIGYYTGKIALGLGLAMLIPLFLSLAFGEVNPAFDFIIACLLSFVFGLFLLIISSTDKEPGWMHGMMVVSLSWLVAMFLGAVPLFLSGHWGSYLDACFDAMSGFATCGLTLVRNLDHLSSGHNMWRLLMMYIGGQGILVVALTFFIRGIAGAFEMYVGEAREERILPNVVHTARFIWLVSFVYLVLGTVVLTFVGRSLGMAGKNSFLHGFWVAIAAWNTGGFAPQSQNILYYHSWLYETITVGLMVMGSLNFRLHYALWTGNRREIYRNIEILTFLFSFVILFSLVVSGMVSAGIYPEKLSLFRKSFYQLISAHTGTGYMTIYATQFALRWNQLAVVAIALAMGVSAGACSTCGGIKVLRVGIVFKAMFEDIKHLILPESSVFIQKFHHIKSVILTDKHVRPAALIILSFILLYLLGTLFGLYFGYPLKEALFESISAGANVGLSCGITSPTMPAALKMVYILEMWLGRLEFISVFALIGFIIAGIKGK